MLALAVYLDVKLSSMEQVQVESVTLDATQALPLATAEFIVQHKSRLSSLQPVAAECATESGPLLVHIAPLSSNDNNKKKKNMYTVNVTCDETAVEYHADLIWKLITAQQTSVLFACLVDVRVKLLHLIPYTQTIYISSSTAGTAGPTTTVTLVEDPQEPGQVPSNFPPPDDSPTTTVHDTTHDETPM